MRTLDRVIDADAHVLECEDTWSFLEPTEQRFRPRLVRDATDDRADQMWLIDGRTTASRAHSGDRSQRRPLLVDVDAATLTNIPKRLAQMDSLGVDVQIIFPTLFLHRMTDRVEVELALVRSYNRWMAARCAQSERRLQWVMELPWMSISDAVDELRECSALGACGVHARGLEVGRVAADRYFYPVFAAAEELNLPISIHAGDGDWKSQSRAFATSEPTFIMSKLPGVTAFHVLAVGSVYEDFPKLRFAFVELSAAWIPYLAQDIRPRYERKLGGDLEQHLFDDKNIFVACENSDDLDRVLLHLGSEHLIFGTDYGHVDTSSDLEGTEIFRKSNSPDLVKQVLQRNPAQLYGLDESSVLQGS